LKPSRFDAKNVNVINIHRRPPVDLAAKLDSFGKPSWIALTILAFWFWLPLGLAALAFLVGLVIMACWRPPGPGVWYRPELARLSGVFGCAGRWASAPSGIRPL